jgi:hypothetical protein
MLFRQKPGSSLVRQIMLQDRSPKFQILLCTPEHIKLIHYLIGLCAPRPHLHRTSEMDGRAGRGHVIYILLLTLRRALLVTTRTHGC